MKKKEKKKMKWQLYDLKGVDGEIDVRNGKIYFNGYERVDE